VSIEWLNMCMSVSVCAPLEEEEEDNLSKSTVAFTMAFPSCQTSLKRDDIS
jgi:hypothetical protein